MGTIDVAYFGWMMDHFENPSVGLERVCALLHNVEFERRVGRDENRAADGLSIREAYLDNHSGVDPREIETFASRPCSWFEMLYALCDHANFIYETGLQPIFMELIDNLGLTGMLIDPDHRYDEMDQDIVLLTVRRVDENLFEPDGSGGLFPLYKSGVSDQRGLELWDQMAAYFREKLEGVLWTSTP